MYFRFFRSSPGLLGRVFFLKLFRGHALCAERAVLGAARRAEHSLQTARLFQRGVFALLRCQNKRASLQGSRLSLWSSQLW